MYHFYRNYYWKNGKPYGFEQVVASESPVSYKIVADPYFKRFSIEKYQYGRFLKVVYDSLLLDFRHLTLKDQTAWQRETLEEKENQSICLLRDQDDRAVLIETLTFAGRQCVACETRSIHGVLLAIHRMYSRNLQAAFDGVMLFDVEERPVMKKCYNVDPVTGEFTELISEQWDFQEASS